MAAIALKCFTGVMLGHDNHAVNDSKPSNSERWLIPCVYEQVNDQIRSAFLHFFIHSFFDSLIH
jgi:hypothetical protein